MWAEVIEWHWNEEEKKDSEGITITRYTNYEKALSEYLEDCECLKNTDADVYLMCEVRKNG